MKRLTTLLVLLCLLPSFVSHTYAQNKAFREVLNMNQHWEFSTQQKNLGQKITLDDSRKMEWEGVHLPHTPRVEHKEFTTHWQGISWYRKQFFAPKKWRGKRIIIKFEAVMQQADVWINGQKISQHLGGFLPFSIDLTEHLIYDGKSDNELIVRADNRDNPVIPPGKNLTGLDMTYQGGIYRSVKLFITDKLCISDAVNANKVASGGLLISYPKVSNQAATVSVQTHVINLNQQSKTCVVKQLLKTADGKVIARSSSEVKTITSGGDLAFNSQLELRNPNLWHPNSPYRYTLQTSVMQDGKLKDQKETKIGIRKLAWKNDGFYINGERLLLNGANRHQDGIYVGNAIPENAQRLEAKKLREAGFNNVRAGHYPLDPAFMDACDEYGLTVIACIPGWHWYQESKAFKENSYQNLRDLIRRDRNHPSVILYETILNETRYSAEYARRAHEISKEEDPTCFVACDFDYPEHRIYDVNYKVPDASLPSFTREWGDDNRYCGIHQNEKGFTWGDWANRKDEHSMVYQSLARQKDLNGDGYWDWYGVNANPNMAGYALWVGFDHNRGATDNIARCGVWGLDRYEKYCYYFLQSQRNPQVKLQNLNSGPMVFIASYWRESSLKDLNIYSNCEKVRLSLNGQVVGEQIPDKFYNEGLEDQPINHVDHPIFTFKNLKWEAGTLLAEGIIDNKVVSTHQVQTPGKAKKIAVDLDHLNEQLISDGSDMGMLYLKAVDDKGTLVPDFNGNVKLGIQGEGRLIGANPVEFEGGVAAIWLRSTCKSGNITVEASCSGLESVKLQTVSTKATQAIVNGSFMAKPAKIRRVEAGRTLKAELNLKKVKNYTLSVSNTKAGYSPNKLNDNDNESWWFSERNSKQWITIELNENTSLAGSLIVWEKDSNWYQFQIKTSSDGINWTIVYEDSQTGHNFELEDWQSTNTKFVKIELLSVEPSNGLLGIREISLFEK